MRAVVDAATARGWTAPSSGFWSLSPDAFGDSAAAADHRRRRRAMGAAQARGDSLPSDARWAPGIPSMDIEDAEARRWLGSSISARAAIARLEARSCSSRSAD